LTLEKYKLSKTQKNQNSGFYLGEFIIRIKDRAALKKAVEESSDPNTSGTQHFSNPQDKDQMLSNLSVEDSLLLELKFNAKSYVNEFKMDLRSDTEDHYYFGTSDLEIKSYIARNIELEGAPDFMEGLPSATKSLFDSQLG
jgi:hypothetical protein